LPPKYKENFNQSSIHKAFMDAKKIDTDMHDRILDVERIRKLKKI
jgi:hypothetical protein